MKLPRERSSLRYGQVYRRDLQHLSAEEPLQNGAETGIGPTASRVDAEEGIVFLEDDDGAQANVDVYADGVGTGERTGERLTDLASRRLL